MELSKKSKWTLVGSILTITMPSSATRSFDMERIYEDFEGMQLNQQFCAQYGVKQNLSDEIAGQKGVSDETKLDLMESRFEELVRGEIKTKREKADSVGKDKFIKATVDALMEFGATVEEATARAEKSWESAKAKEDKK